VSRRLQVLLHDQPIGELIETPYGSDFVLSEAYWALPGRPVLGQFFEERRGRGSFRSGLGKRLPSYFANLCPEGELRRIITRSSGLAGEDDFGLLTHVGQDLPGAVRLRALSPLEEAARAVAGSDGEPSDSTRDEALRFSLAGVQLKFSMLREAEKLTLPVRESTGEWIVKLESPVFPGLPENEYSMLEWARLCRFEVPECRLHERDELSGFVRDLTRPGSSVFAVRRYDRDGGRRIHQEDFAQVLGLQPDMKYEQVTYEQLARLGRAILGEEGLDEYLRRLAFLIGSGNSDAHLKNWSLLYPERFAATWAPLYDQVATIAWPNTVRGLALNLAGAKEFYRIETTNLRRFAVKAGLDEGRVAEIVTSTLGEMRTAWPHLAPSLPLFEDHRQALREHWQFVPLLRSIGPLIG
jgi:serine/threonine-protein kinase HipA